MILSQDIITLLRNHPLTRPLHPTHFGISKNATGSCNRFNGDETHILILCVGGQGFIQSQEVNANIITNDLLLIPANCPHSYGAVADQTWSIYWTHFSGEDAWDFYKPLTGVSLIHCPELLFNKALSIYRDYYNCLSQSMTHNNLIIASQILRYLLAHLFYSRLSDSASDFARSGIEKAIELMKKNIDKSITVQYIASHVGLSKSHFLYLFKKETGFSPIDYFNTMKIRHASENLISTDLHIGAVGESIGIQNQHYFSRLFKKIMGVSPREYRKQNAWTF